MLPPALTEQYLQTYLYRDVKRLFPRLDELALSPLRRALGGLSGRVLKLRDTARALAVSQPTAATTSTCARHLSVRRVPAFSRDASKRLVRHPRGYLRDSGLLHALLRIPMATPS